MTRKSGKRLRVTYGTLNSCFDLIGSHQQCTPQSPLVEIEPTTTVGRSRKSTTGSPVHVSHKRAELTSHGDNARPLDLMCLEGTYSLQRTRPPPGLRLPKSEL